MLRRLFELCVNSFINHLIYVDYFYHNLGGGEGERGAVSGSSTVHQHGVAVQQRKQG